MVFPGDLLMTPVGILMIEHRLIERMIEILKRELLNIKKSKKIKPKFIETAVDFIRTYADKHHHGKEEDIFFKVLLTKKLETKDKNYIFRLIDEHKQGRATVGKLVAAKDDFLKEKPKALHQVIKYINWLIDFYPRHIKKEDGYFFTLYKAYLTEKEQDKMLLDFLNFTKEPIHDKYAALIGKLEKRY